MLLVMGEMCDDGEQTLPTMGTDTNKYDVSTLPTFMLLIINRKILQNQRLY